MMTAAEEKAKELFDKYYLKTESGMDKDFGWVCISLNKGMAKQCALIAVDEIILSIIQIHSGMTWSERKQTTERNTGYAYWTDVKRKIEKL
jgi:hypothetical protein